ncbi:hypothetical protein GOV09_04465 [Candidatus Woesearchaeota archaeon]|nr:hypothetical protein [Candidatus Woesearchaeota archaeon]
MALFGKKRDPAANMSAGMPMDAPGPDPGYYEQQQAAPQQPDYSQQGSAQPDQGQQGYEQAYPEPAPPDPGADFGGYEGSSSYGGDDIRERVEEIAEAIIDEKWNNLMKDINKVIEWKEQTETVLNTVIQEIKNLKERFESLHKGILGKISEYDQNLTNVGSEIKAMEMAFQKILPTFTENVNKLERYTKGFSK